MSFGIPNARFKFRMPTATNNGRSKAVWNAGSIQSINVEADSISDGDQLYYDGTQRIWVTGTPPASALIASTGSVSNPSITFIDDQDTGLYNLAADTIGFTAGGIRQLSIDSDEHIMYAGPTATSTALRFTTSGGTTYIQNSAQFDKSSGAPTGDTYQTIRFSPYSSVDPIFDITNNGVRTATGAVGAPSYSFLDDTDSGMYLIGPNEFGFATNGTLRTSISTTNITDTLPNVYPYATAAGTDAGVTIPDGTQVFTLTAGTETGPYALTGPTGVQGQVLFVHNGSGQNTTGLVTTAGAGAVFVYDGSSWLLSS